MKLKKLIFVLMVLISMGLVTACGKDKKPSFEDRLGGQEAVLESFEGKIEGVSKDVYQEGTHRLKTKEGEIIFLQSPTIDLNKYVDKNVLVQGKLKKAVGTAKPVLTVSKIEYIKAQADETGLKLYENKALGLKFKYPETWLLDETGETLNFSFEEEPMAKIKVSSNETNLDKFADSKQGGKGERVTVASQQALRYLSGSEIMFYVPNPSKKKIYEIQFSPSEQLESEDVERLEAQFYKLLKTVQLLSLSQPKGKVCGGEPPVFCPEDYFCELNDSSEFAEGICLPIGGEAKAEDCPYIAPPSECTDYQISDYDENACPTSYECFEGDEGHTGTDFIPGEGGHEVPPISAVTGEYTNEKLGFILNYPKSWYYVSFGVVDGTQEKVGFSSGEFEGLDEALITLSLQKTDGGQASKKVGDLYYVFDGPSDLTEVMEEMAGSVEKVEGE